MKQRLPLFLLLIAILSAAILAVRRHYTTHPVTRDLSGGAKVQRERIDRFIGSTSEMNVELAIESLNDNGETFGVVSLAALSPSSLGRCYIKQVLADRRASKIFQHLTKLPSEKSSDFASGMFDAKLAMMTENFKQMARGDVDPNDSVAKLGPDHHAASVGLFFCSYFCTPRVLDEKLQKWDSQMNTPEISKIDGVQYLSLNRFIDPLFRINLLVISGSRNGATSIETLSSELEKIAQKVIGANHNPFFPISKLNMFKWDAETLDTDFTNVTRGVPASGNSILIQLPGFADSNSGAYLEDEQVFSGVL